MVPISNLSPSSLKPFEVLPLLELSHFLTTTSEVDLISPMLVIFQNGLDRRRKVTDLKTWRTRV